MTAPTAIAAATANLCAAILCAAAAIWEAGDWLSTRIPNARRKGWV